jgi:hypothetical protein
MEDSRVGRGGSVSGWAKDEGGGASEARSFGDQARETREACDTTFRPNCPDEPLLTKQ